MLSNRISQLCSNIVLISIGFLKFTFCLLVFLTKLFYNLSLLLNFFLQTVVLLIFLQKLFFGSLAFVYQYVLALPLLL